MNLINITSLAFLGGKTQQKKLHNGKSEATMKEFNVLIISGEVGSELRWGVFSVQ
jgi:hypothetical protein